MRSCSDLPLTVTQGRRPAEQRRCRARNARGTVRGRVHPVTGARGARTGGGL